MTSPNLRSVFGDVCGLSVEDDGLEFSKDGIEIEEIREAEVYQGLRVADDVLLVGCDGIEDTRFVTPELGAIEIPMAESCSRGWRLLERRMHEKDIPVERVVLTSELVVRGSSTRR